MKKKRLLIIGSIVIAILIGVNFMIKRELHFEEEVLIEKNIDEVWEVLGNQFTEVDKWSANFISSKGSGEPKLEGLGYLHRETMTAKGANFQEMDEFDPSSYRLKYHVSKGLPGIAGKGIGEWSLTKVDSLKTKLNVHFILETKGLLGLVMSPLISMKVGKSSGEIAEELKYYLENGKPHPRKVEASRK